MLTPGEGVLVDVHAAGVSFPELLQTRGAVPAETAAAVRAGQRGRRRRAQRARGRGGAARATAWRPSARSAASPRRSVAPEFFTFPLSPELDFAQGAGLILNYHTAYFALVAARPPEGGRDGARPRRRRRRGHGRRCRSPRRVGARTIALVSSEEKATVAEEAGADEVVLLGEGWKDEVKELSGGGVDVVLDPVGGDRFTDSLRSLREDGRLLVVGFTGGSIPEVKVNRLLLQQHRGRGRRLGRLRDGQARAQPRDRRGGQRAWSTTASSGRSSASASRSSDAAEALQRARRAPRDRQGRARRAARLAR